MSVEKIIKKNSLEIYNQALNNAVSDERLSLDEETTLKKLKRNLGLSEDDIEQGGKFNKKELSYFSLLWDVENGYLPELDNAPIILQKNEVVHFYVVANLLESKLVTTHFDTVGQGISIKITKGLWYRVGGSRGRSIKKQVNLQYPGTLVVTNKRVVFSAMEKGFTIPFSSLTSFDPYSDGIGLQKNNYYYLLNIENKNAELFCMFLSQSAKKYFEE